MSELTFSGVAEWVIACMAWAIATVIFISGTDDLIIDVTYWARAAWRHLTIYRKNERVDFRRLAAHREKPFAIMVPAWQEHGVIDHMAELAARSLAYENYYIFVGTYPNDPQTQADVEKVRSNFPNVHKVVCARPGPTSKADCLNNVLDAILQFEKLAGFEFAGFVLHDSEDVMSSCELQLFNWLVDRKDLIQVPVYPLPRPWTDFTGGHYLDEFAESHGKDIVVREALVGQVPSAGVGTCFSRRAILALIEQGNGIAFDAQSLTEDYDIGWRLKALGMTEIFVRASEPVRSRPKKRGWALYGQSPESLGLISVREYFPSTLKTAIRQKSRWIIGIIYQGARNAPWTSSPKLNYFLWRDRKGALTNFIGFLAMLFGLLLLTIYAGQRLFPDLLDWPDGLPKSPIFQGLLFLNLILFFNRFVQRVYFVTRFYGVLQGLLSIPRMFWGNVINFGANCRALRQVLQMGDSRRVAWDKTCHEFPVLDSREPPRRNLGDVLEENGDLTRPLFDSIVHTSSIKLSAESLLIRSGIVTADQVVAALGKREGLPYESFHSLKGHCVEGPVATGLIAKLPAAIALRYGLLPLREEGDVLVLASETGLDPVALAAIVRKLRRPVRLTLVPKGFVVVGLRQWYVRGARRNVWQRLAQAVRKGKLTEPQTIDAWKDFVSRQVLLGEVLIGLGFIREEALVAPLIDLERRGGRLGRLLESTGAISREQLKLALKTQAVLQGEIHDYLHHVKQLDHTEGPQRKETNREQQQDLSMGHLVGTGLYN